MTNPNENKDFQDFLSSGKMEHTPSLELDNQIKGYVQRDLNPDKKVVYLKLISTQAFIEVLTLLFCPQFEMSFTSNHDLYHYFHYTFGILWCFAICGSIFIGSGAIFAAYILNLSEVRVIKENRILSYLSLSIIALMTFIGLGAEVYLNAVVAWISGATFGGLIMLELNSILKEKLLRI